jgi:hypothetical protein
MEKKLRKALLADWSLIGHWMVIRIRLLNNNMEE